MLSDYFGQPLIITPIYDYISRNKKYKIQKLQSTNLDGKHNFENFLKILIFYISVH